MCAPGLGQLFRLPDDTCPALGLVVDLEGARADARSFFLSLALPGLCFSLEEGGYCTYALMFLFSGYRCLAPVLFIFGGVVVGLE